MPGSQKQKFYADRLQHLNRLGFTLPLDTELLDSRLSEVAVEQCASELECPIIDLSDSRTLYVVWVSF